MTIINVGTNAITIQDKANLSGSLMSFGGVNVTIPANQGLPVRYIAAAGFWVNSVGYSSGGGLTINADCNNANTVLLMSGTGTTDCSPGGGSPLSFNGFGLGIPGTLALAPTSPATCSGSLALSESFHSFERITITGNCTLSSSGGQPGSHVLVLACQDATGGHTLTWPATYNNTPTTVTTASKCTFGIFDTADGTNFYR